MNSVAMEIAKSAVPFFVWFLCSPLLSRQAKLSSTTTSWPGQAILARVAASRSRNARQLWPIAVWDGIQSRCKAVDMWMSRIGQPVPEESDHLVDRIGAAQ